MGQVHIELLFEWIDAGFFQASEGGQDDRGDGFAGIEHGSSLNVGFARRRPAQAGNRLASGWTRQA
jgi:hypothetical protein